MHIMICDDEKSTCAELEDIFLKYASERDIRQQVDIFYSGDTLMEYLGKGNSPDILFLDIEIPGTNGVAVGDYIRSVLENEQIYIVYISSKQQYAMQLFQNRPFDFLVKPLDDRKIYDVLDRIFRIAGKENCEFVYPNNGGYYRIAYRDILYFVSEGRKIKIVTKSGTESFYSRLDEVKKKIPESIFLNIHKSYLVNINYVKTYAYENITMLNGDILNISKANRMWVRKKIMEKEADEFRNS